MKLFALLAAALCSAAVQAQDYPSRPLRFIVPYPPGALTDVLARVIGDRLGTALKQPVVVENRAGAGTLIGADLVAKAPADGYTLLMATSTTLGISPAIYSKPQIDPVKDFAPVSLVGSVNFFLVTSPSLRGKDRRRVDRPRAPQPGQVQLRLLRQRQPAPPVHGGVQEGAWS